jgi:hypothetical protein
MERISTLNDQKSTKAKQKDIIMIEDSLAYSQDYQRHYQRLNYHSIDFQLVL